MKKEDLFDAIGKVDDKMIAQSGKRTKRKNKALMRTLLATAACLVVILGITIAMQKSGLLKPLTPNIENPNSEQANSGQINSEQGNSEVVSEGMGTGSDEPDFSYDGPTIMDGGEGENIDIEYAYGMNPESEFIEFNPGPLMPMTLAQENSAITAQRDMTYGFSNVTKASNGFVKIHDKYILTNTSDIEQKVTLVYPYLGTILDMNEENRPKLLVDGNSVTTDIVSGKYYGSDGFGYEQLLSFGLTTDDMESVIGNVSDHVSASTIDKTLWDKKVVVYEFSDVKCGGNPSEYGVYAVKIKADDYKDIYFENISGVTYHDGYMYVGFDAKDVLDGETPRIIFMDGKEPMECIGQGYSCMEFYDEYKVDDVSANMTKKEIAFGEVFEEVVRTNSVAKFWGEDRPLSEQEQKIFLEFAAQIVADVVKRNDSGDEMSDMAAYFSNSLSNMVYYAYTGTTLFLVKSEVTIPAGGSVNVIYTYDKQGQHDCTYPELDFLDCYGYENAINMGTNVTYTSQVANIVEQDNIEIIDQNYKFDLNTGVNSVKLALDVEKYYMVVRILK